MTKAKRRPGRPISTGSDSTKRVQFRVSAAQREELDREGAALGVSGDAVAKLRVFDLAYVVASGLNTQTRRRP